MRSHEVPTLPSSTSLHWRTLEIQRAPFRSSPAARVARLVRLGFALLLLGCGEAAEAPLVGEALQRALPRRADLRVERGELYWTTSDGTAHRVRSAAVNEALALTLPSSKPVHVAWTLTDPSFEDPLRALPELLRRWDVYLAAAPEHAAASDPPLYRFDPLSGGFVLEAREAWIGEQATLIDVVPRQRLLAPRRTHAAARAELARAVAAFDAWIEESALTAPSQASLRESLQRAALRDDEDEDYPSPSFVRRLIRSGWLDALARNDARAARLAKAMQRTEHWALARAQGTQGWLRSELVDAYGRALRVERSPAALRYQVQLPEPAYFSDIGPLELVVELEPHADMFSASVPLRAARVFARDVLIAEWTAAQGFVAYPQRWQEKVSLHTHGTESWVMPNALPPHVLIVTPQGDVRSLITAHGQLEPKRAATPVDTASFLESAARALPDAAHLDLLGEYLYAYVHDSPDPRFPELLGTQSLVGDIHQTVPQTLAGLAGGMYRGDCDDLSELYQEITQLQGRNTHLLGLPAHAAAGWVERRHGRHWTYVLQTAPPLAVPGRTLEDSLETAYRSFDAQAVIDVDQLEILLRFADDNTRDSYYLSARIFEDPAYARAMTDLQEDWHRFSFHAALTKIDAILAADPDRVAHLLERASLESMISQPARAAHSYEQARERAQSPIQRIQIAIQELEARYRAHELERATALLDQIIDVDMPAIEERAGERAFDLWLMLASELLERDRAPERALEILSERLAPRVRARERWYETAEQRYRLQAFMELGIEALRSTRRIPSGAAESRKSLEGLIGLWFESDAFASPDPAESVLRTYGWLGRYLEAIHGADDYQSLIDAQSPPRSAERDHAQRSSEVERAALDAAWIGISPYYWWKALSDLVSWHHASLDRPRALRIAHRLRVAQVQARAIGLDHPEFSAFAVHSQIVSAIAARNLEQLREALRNVHRSHDRELAAGAAFWLAQLGRRTSLAEFESCLRVALEELDVPALFLRIAWDSVAADAWEHGLLAAGIVARAHPELPQLSEELAFMQRLHAERPTRAARDQRRNASKRSATLDFPAEMRKK